MTRDVTWRYFVHGGRTFCPQRMKHVAVSTCHTCPHLESIDDGETPGTVACLPPPGEDEVEMIEALATAGAAPDRGTGT